MGQSGAEWAVDLRQKWPAESRVSELHSEHVRYDIMVRCQPSNIKGPNILKKHPFEVPDFQRCPAHSCQVSASYQFTQLCVISANYIERIIQFLTGMHIRVMNPSRLTFP